MTDLTNSIDFDELFTMPTLTGEVLIAGGYDIMAVDAPHIIDRLEELDYFLIDHQYDGYYYSKLRDMINNLLKIGDTAGLIENLEAINIELFVIDKVLPAIAPKNYVYRLSDSGKHYGLYPERPLYTTTSKGKGETAEMIVSASTFTKLMFINENKESFQLRNPINALDDICFKIIDGKHFKPFYDVKEESCAYSEDEKAAYIRTHHNVLNWVVENIFFEDFKASIDKITGYQDISRLWHGIVSQDNVIIDGIDQVDLWILRESCEDCKGIEDLDSDEWHNKDCSCQGYDESHNVWLISNRTFYEYLKECGAMVYETDSLYVYLQTDHAGKHYDGLLRQAWVTMYTRSILPTLDEVTII